MSTPTHSQPVIILEGPDGAGKTTLAYQLAEMLDARYVHLGPMASVKDVSRIYVEAMLPAIQGYQPVVMDRAWFSEAPYGAVFREGKLRNDLVIDAMLERIVLACTGAVIYCNTDPKRLVESFTSRKGEEYLDRADQLLDVARRYRERMGQSTLHMVSYDYTKGHTRDVIGELGGCLELQDPHKVCWKSAGNLGAKVLLVGECFTSHKNHDTLLQRPFVSFNRNGSSYWLTRHLQAAGIFEDQLCWINQDQGLETIADLICHMGELKHVVCLGAEATKTINGNAIFVNGLSDVGVKIHDVPHPQHHRRFKHHEPYPLIDIIKESI